MSAIAGILRFDGDAADRRDLERMANALHGHGPDRSEVLVAGAAGFAHLLMRTTPEDRFDRQPFRGASGAVITADLRIDNRDELIDRLGLAQGLAADWSDSRLLMTAWERWGDELWPSLRGVFAAAIWDPRRQRLTLARDHLGLNVVMWHRTPRFFAFATMPKGLFALPDVPSVLSEEKLADFLVLNHADHQTTHYRDIFRLPPAHMATIDTTGAMSVRRYWSASDIKRVRLATDEDYAQALRAHLDKAVRRQMRSAHQVGCYLSGGLDSSAVAALAAGALAEKGERLAAFTHVPRAGFDGPVPRSRYADETPFVEAICAAVGNIDVTYIRNDEHDDFADLERIFLGLEAPVRNPTNLGWTLAIQRMAKEQNRRVLLGGDLGNFTISWPGWGQTVDHVLSGRFVTAYRQWRMLYKRSPDSRFTSFRKLILDPLVPDRIVNRFARRRRGRTGSWLEHSPIRPEFAAEMQVTERANETNHDFFYRARPGAQAARFSGLTLVDYLGDWRAAEKAITGIDVRDPTADLDVVEFCLGIPPEQFLAEDVDRSLVRRAMWGLLPEVVLTNPRSGMQSADWFEKLSARREAMAAEVEALKASPLASRAIDLDRIGRALRDWPSGNWEKASTVREYHFVLTRGLAAARFVRWHEAANR